MSDAQLVAFEESFLPLDVLNYLLPCCTELTRFTFTLVSKYFRDKSVNPYVTFPVSDALFSAALEGDLDLLRELWPSRILNPEFALKFDLRYAATWNGHIPVLEWFEEINPLNSIKESEILEMGVFFHALHRKQKNTFEYLLSKGYRCPSFLIAMYSNAFGDGGDSVAIIAEKYSSSIRGDMGSLTPHIEKIVRTLGFPTEDILSNILDESFYSNMKLNDVAFVLPIQHIIEMSPLLEWVENVKAILWRHEWRLIKSIILKIAEYDESSLVNLFNNRVSQACRRIMDAILQSGRSDVLDFYVTHGLTRIIPLDIHSLFLADNSTLVRTIILSHREPNDIKAAIESAFHCGALGFLQWLDELHLLKNYFEPDMVHAVASSTFPTLRRWAIEEARIVAMDENYLLAAILTSSILVLKELVPKVFPKLPEQCCQAIKAVLEGECEVNEITELQKFTQKNQSLIRELATNEMKFGPFLSCLAYLIEVGTYSMPLSKLETYILFFNPHHAIRFVRDLKLDIDIFDFAFFEKCLNVITDPADLAFVVKYCTQKELALERLLESSWFFEKDKYRSILFKVVSQFTVTLGSDSATFSLKDKSYVINGFSETAQRTLEDAIKKRTDQQLITSDSTPLTSSIPSTVRPSKPVLSKQEEEVGDKQLSDGEVSDPKIPNILRTEEEEECGFETASEDEDFDPEFSFSSLPPVSTTFTGSFSFQNCAVPLNLDPSPSQFSFSLDTNYDAFSDTSTFAFTNTSSNKKSVKSPQKKKEVDWDDLFGFTQ